MLFSHFCILKICDRPVSMRLDDTDNQRQGYSSTIDKSLQSTDISPKILVAKTYPSETPSNVQPAAAAAAVDLSNFGQDLVGQLQRAVREEMRRIMEVCQWVFFIFVKGINNRI